MKNLAIISMFLIALLTALPVVAYGSDFATEIISYSGPFGPSPYDDPAAILGEPTTLIKRNETDIFACSVVYGAWNTAPDGSKLIVTLAPGSEIVAGFDHKVSDDLGNPYGIDFIVFGNTAFKTASTEYIAPDSDMDQWLLSSPTSVLTEPVVISVAQDPNGPWYSFANGPYADDLFPTNAYEWDSVLHDWGQKLDWLKPVNPDLSTSDFDGLSAAQAIDLYEGSAGGTGFDLTWLEPEDYQALRIDPFTGRKWIKYIKVTSSYAGEIDAFADVAGCGDYQHPYPIGDINSDCKVNLMDFAMLSENWLDCTWDCD